MITCILQFEISFKMKSSNLGHDLIDIISCNMYLKLVYEYIRVVNAK